MKLVPKYLLEPFSCLVYLHVVIAQERARLLHARMDLLYTHMRLLSWGVNVGAAHARYTRATAA